MDPLEERPDEQSVSGEIATQGYPIELFTTVVSDHLLCCICKNVVRNAVTGCSRGHAFCACCLRSWRGSGGSKCPLCAIDIHDFQATPCLPIVALISSLPVCCGVSTDGEEACEWQGTLDMRPRHIAVCSKAPVPCGHESCGLTVQRARLEEHMATCQHKPVRCEDCSAWLPPAKFPAHRAETCPGCRVPCTLAACGCTARPKRCDQAEHQVAAAAEHAMLLNALLQRARSIEAGSSALQGRIEASNGLWQPDVEHALSRIKHLCQMAQQDELRQRLVRDGSIQTVVGTMLSSASSAELQEWGCMAILRLCNTDEEEEPVVHPPPVRLRLSPVRSKLKLIVGRARTGDRGSGIASNRSSMHGPEKAGKGEGSSTLPAARDGRQQRGQAAPPPSTKAPREENALAPEESEHIASGLRSAFLSGGHADHGDAEPAIVPRTTKTAPAIELAARVEAIRAIVGAMKRHTGVSLVVQYGASAMKLLCGGCGEGVSERKQQAVDAGGLDVTVAGMAAHISSPVVQRACCELIRILAAYDGVATEDALAHGAARSQVAVEGGALERLVAAMHAHLSDADVQREALAAIASVCHTRASLEQNAKESLRAVKQRASDAGALRAAGHALSRHGDNMGVQREAIAVLIAVCAGARLNRASQQRAANSGILEPLIAQLHKGGGPGETARDRANRYRALRTLVTDNPIVKIAAEEAGAKPEWL